MESVADLKAEIAELREEVRGLHVSVDRAEAQAYTAEAAKDDAESEARYAQEALSKVVEFFADYERGIRDLDEVHAIVRDLRVWA